MADEYKIVMTGFETLDSGSPAARVHMTGFETLDSGSPVINIYMTGFEVLTSIEQAGWNPKVIVIM